MARRNFSVIVNSMIDLLRRLRPQVDTKEGTFTRDVVIDAPASEFDVLYRAIENVSNSQSPDTATSQSLTGLARNLQNPRKGAQRAVGIITFYRISVPPGVISIPRGTVVTSKGSLSVSSKQFMTTQDTVMSVVNFNPNTARYEVDVPIRAITGGADGNVPAGSITVVASPLPNIVGCYNSSATTNGRDRESDIDCATRVKSIFNGNNVGTSSGYYLTMLANSNVSDTKVVTPDNTTIAKRASSGVVDILIRGGIPTQPVVEAYTYTTGTPYYIPARQPLYADASGSFVLQGSITGVLTQGVNYSVEYDNSVLAGSIRAADRFVFLSGLTDGEVITFTYTYNSLIEDLQISVDSDTAKSVTADVLVKAAKQRLINVSATIGLLAGYSADEVSVSVQTAVETALNNYTIGEEVQQSDIISVITAIAGVDQVLVPLGTFEEDASTGNISQNSDGNLVIPADSYATSGHVVISIHT